MGEVLGITCTALEMNWERERARNEYLRGMEASKFGMSLLEYDLRNELPCPDLLGLNSVLNGIVVGCRPDGYELRDRAAERLERRIAMLDAIEGIRRDVVFRRGSSGIVLKIEDTLRTE